MRVRLPPKALFAPCRRLVRCRIPACPLQCGTGLHLTCALDPIGGRLGFHPGRAGSIPAGRSISAPCRRLDRRCTPACSLRCGAGLHSWGDMFQGGDCALQARCDRFDSDSLHSLAVRRNPSVRDPGSAREDAPFTRGRWQVRFLQDPSRSRRLVAGHRVFSSGAGVRFSARVRALEAQSDVHPPSKRECPGSSPGEGLPMTTRLRRSTP